MDAVKNTSDNQPWWLINVRAVLFIVVGLILFISNNQYTLTVKIIIGLCLLVAGLMAIRFWQVSKDSGASDFWILLNGTLDALIGLGLLFYTTDPTNNIVFLFSFWGVITGVLGAVETIFISLGMQDSSRAATDFSLVILNGLTVLVGGGLAFMLIIQPFEQNSIHYSGLIVIALGVLLAIESRNLKKDAQAGAVR